MLTNSECCDIINLALEKSKQFAGVAQLVEQLICNQQVGGSSPSTSSKTFPIIISGTNIVGDFPSGQRGQTVNLLRFASVVRIHNLPPENPKSLQTAFRVIFFITESPMSRAALRRGTSCGLVIIHI